MPKDDWNPLRQAYARGLLLPLGIVAVVLVGARIISDETDVELRNTLFGVGFGLIIIVLTLWISRLYESRAESSAGESNKAPIPLEALPPYQPIEPTITIEIPARTMVVVVLSLAALTMIYFYVLRGDRGDDA